MENVASVRVALLSVGEKMYPQDYLGNVVRNVRQSIRKLDVEVVSEHVIMCEEDAVVAREILRETAFDVIIVNVVSWHITPYVMQILKGYRAVPILVWGIGGKTASNGTLYSPAAAAGITALVPVLKSMGYSYHVMCEMPDEPMRLDAVNQWLKIAGAATRIRDSRIGLVGYADMGLYTCSYDRQEVFTQLGVDIENYFDYEVIHAMELCPDGEATKIMADIKARAVLQNDIPDAVIEKCARLFWAMRGQADRRKLDAISIKCVDGVTGYLGFNPCLAQSLLASKDLSVICECDAYGALTHVILSKLTGQTSAFMENYEVFEDSVLVGVCGFIPGDFVEGSMCIRHANLGEANTGVSNVSKVKTGLVTFARLYHENNQFKMFISRGLAQDCPKWTELGWSTPTPDFPSVKLQLEMPVQKYLETVPGQHIVMVYGDWKEQLVELCNLLRIQPICPE